MVMWQCGLLSDKATFLDGLFVEELKEREVKIRWNSYLLKLSLVEKLTTEAVRLRTTRKAIPALHTTSPIGFVAHWPLARTLWSRRCGAIDIIPIPYG